MAPSHSQNTCPCVSPIRQKGIIRNRYATFLELEEILSRARRLAKCLERFCLQTRCGFVSLTNVMVAHRSLVLDAVVGEWELFAHSYRRAWTGQGNINVRYPKSTEPVFSTPAHVRLTVKPPIGVLAIPSIQGSDTGDTPSGDEPPSSIRPGTSFETFR